MVTSSVFSCLLCTLIAILALTCKCASEKLPAANIVKKSTDDHENDESIEDNAESAEKRSACDTGFEESGGGCNDIDECTLNRCDSQTTSCYNIDGSYLCPCKEGYEMKKGYVQENSTECERKDLCLDRHQEEQTHRCDKDTTTCVKTNGSFSCTCKKGYDDLHTKGSIDHKANNYISWECSDVDECVVDNRCVLDTSTCLNFPGGFSCICSKGYYNDEHEATNCKDIDECTDESHKCSSPSAVCKNLVGSYTCECAEGYENYTSSNDTRIKKDTLIRSCADIDECVCPEPCACAEARCIEEEPNRMKREDKSGTNGTTTHASNALNDINVKCKNTDGGYSCECHVSNPYCVKRRNGMETECRDCNPYPCGSREIRGDCSVNEATTCSEQDTYCDTDGAGGNETETKCTCTPPWSDTYCDTANHTLRNVNDSVTVSSPLYPSSYLRVSGLEAKEKNMSTLRWFVNSPDLPTDQQVKIQVEEIFHMKVPCYDRVELEDVSTEQPVTYFVANCTNWPDCNSTCITTNSTSLRLTLTRNRTQGGEGKFILTFQRVSSDYTCPICD